MRGASATQRVLQETTQQRLAVFVVWEPILPTDWQPPSALALGRIKDQRARQYWDQDHLVSQAVRQSLLAPGAPEPSCCMQGDHLWDMVMLYAPGTQWEGLPPRPALADGPVVQWTAQLRRKLNGR